MTIWDYLGWMLFIFLGAVFALALFDYIVGEDK